MGSIQDYHAIVFGCSGINGWAVVNQLLSGYPSSGTFSRVTAICNRKFHLDDARWPYNSDNRLQVISGVDLLVEDDESLEKLLAEQISSVKTITHVYYAGNEPVNSLPTTSS